MMMSPMSSDPEVKLRTHHLDTPLTEDKVSQLRSGDILYLSGTIYGARDAAHKRMLAEIREGKKLPRGKP